MSNLNDLLRRVAEETFESLAFMFAAPDADGEARDTSIVSALVAFSGPFDGAVRLSIERAMLAELAANMLGEMDADALSDDERTDGFGELLNVLCGNLLPRLVGETVVFDVKPPRVTDDAPPDDQRRARIELELDEGRATVELYADAEIPEPAGAFD